MGTRELVRRLDRLEHTNSAKQVKLISGHEWAAMTDAQREELETGWVVVVQERYDMCEVKPVGELRDYEG